MVWSIINNLICLVLIFVKIINLLYQQWISIFWYVKLTFKLFHFFLKNNNSIQKFLSVGCFCVLYWDWVEDDTSFERWECWGCCHIVCLIQGKRYPGCVKVELKKLLVRSHPTNFVWNRHTINFFHLANKENFIDSIV